MHESIYITGIGIVSGVGLSVDDHLRAFGSKKAQMGAVTLFETSLDVPVSEVKLSSDCLQSILGLPSKQVFSRTALLGMLAVRQAVDDSGVDVSSTRVGLISSTSVGGIDLSERFFRDSGGRPEVGRLRRIVSHDCGDSTERMADYLGVRGYITTLSTACSSAANAVMFAARLIRQNMLDTVIVGGVDSLCAFTLHGFNSLMILDKAHCRPFDKTRAGLNLGEGAGFLVLQSEASLNRVSGSALRKSPSIPYARLAGYANANDAYHQTASSPDGVGPYMAMEQALRMAGLSAQEIDYVNVHGTGTENNDFSEGTALRRLFGQRMPAFSSTKPFTGHTLGAAGGIEAVLSVLSVARGIVYPNLNFSEPMEGLDLIPETEYRTGVPVRAVLSNSFGFGGNDSTLIFTKA